MSNNNKILTKEQQYQQDCVHLLGSLAFVELIDQYDLPKQLYNELFAAHCLTLGLLSSGIKEGSINIRYCTSTEDGFEPGVIGPRLNYAFYTVRNQLIQKGNSCTNSSIHINNKEFNKYKYPRHFRDFLDNHWKHMKHMHNYTFDDFKDYEFKIECRGKYANKTLQIEHLYNNIIEKTYCVHSFLNWYFLQNKIELKTNDIVKKKKI